MRSRLVLAALLLFASWWSRPAAAQAKGPDVPANLFLKPTGPFAVGTHDMVFIDSKRPETLTKDPSDRRHVPVQIWYPAEPSAGEPAPYIRRPDEFGSFTGFKGVLHVKTNAITDAPIAKQERKYPVLLYNHGGSWTRFSATFETEQLASRGYIVVSVDHLGFDKSELMPDGYRFKSDTLQFPKPTETDRRADALASWDYLNQVLFPIWVDDASFVLDQVEQLSKQPGPFHDRVDLDRIGAFGWSFGGATSMELAVRDRRIKAAIDQDGQLFGQARSTGTSRPVMLMHNGSDPMAEAKESERAVMGELVAQVHRWDSVFRASSTGELYDVTIAKTQHGNFSDLTLFFPRSDKLMDPRRAHEIILAYTEAFFDKYLKGKPTSDLLTGPPAAYPEVTFSKK
jgi:predicted dienelactone hydrolase